MNRVLYIGMLAAFIGLQAGNDQAPVQQKNIVGRIKSFMQRKEILGATCMLLVNAGIDVVVYLYYRRQNASIAYLKAIEAESEDEEENDLEEEMPQQTRQEKTPAQLHHEQLCNRFSDFLTKLLECSVGGVEELSDRFIIRFYGNPAVYDKSFKKSSVGQQVKQWVKEQKEGSKKIELHIYDGSVVGENGKQNSLLTIIG